LLRYILSKWFIFATKSTGMNKTVLMLYHHYVIDPTLLSWEEKIIMSYVRSWRNKGTCFGSDQFFHKLLGCDNYQIDAILASLVLRDKLVITSDSTGSRILSLGKQDRHPINHNDYFNSTNNTDIFDV
jgi:hypothetical protein